jgi:hypothetical protein
VRNLLSFTANIPCIYIYCSNFKKIQQSREENGCKGVARQAG